MTLNRRGFLKQIVGGGISFTVLGSTAYTYAKYIEPRWIEVTYQSLYLPRLSSAFAQYRIVQISDLHMDQGFNADRLNIVVTQINTQAPDMVVITGDFVNAIVFLQQAIPILRKIRAKDGVYGVLGNHDHWEDFAPQVRKVLADAYIAELRNDVKTIRRGQQELHLVGLDDVLEGEPNLDRTLGQLPPHGSAILLVHEPDYADISAQTGRFDLQLSGHTHGGQVSIPVYGPPITPRLGKKYSAGLYQIETMKLYTNRGLGVLPNTRLRFNARPEITVFTLVGSQ